jgi:hypothetical protein
VGATAVASTATAVLATVAGRQYDDGPTLEGRYVGSMTVSPTTVLPGSELRVDLTKPDKIDALLFTRWSAGGYHEVYDLDQGRWTKVSDGSGGFYIGVSGTEPSRSYDVKVAEDARPGRYRVCSIDVRACALVTIERTSAD